MKLFNLKLLLPLLLLVSTAVKGQVDFTTIHYRGVRPDDWNGLMPFRNPGRGFMFNDTLDLSANSNSFKTGLDSNSNLKRQMLKYASDSITLVYTTLYLPSDQNAELAETALKELQFYFDALHELGLKCLLHLTYKIVSGVNKSQKSTDVKTQKSQLLPLLTKNKDIILELKEGLMGSWSFGKDGLPEGGKAALKLKLNQITYLSLMGSGGNGNSKNLSMDNWRNIPVGSDQLLADKIPFSEDYFKSSSGNIVQRPMFDFIRDYLGYRIELQQLILPAKRPDNSPIHLKLEIINRGFSALKQSYSVAFVLIDPTGKVFELPTDADPASWQPFAAGDVNFKPISHFVEYTGKLPLHLIPGRYKLGIWIADAGISLHNDYRYDIRCANGNTGWWISTDNKYGINILTSLTISK